MADDTLMRTLLVAALVGILAVYCTAQGTVLSSVTVTQTGRLTRGIVLPQGRATSAVQVGSYQTQTDVLNRWPDGSIKFAILSFNATSTGTQAIRSSSNPGGSFTPVWPFNTQIAFTIGGTTYTAALPAFNGTNTVYDGAVMRESWVMVTPTAGGFAHPLLQVIFDIRSYAAGGHEVDITVQNVKNTAAIDKITYDVTISVNNATVYHRTGYTHYTGQRWHKIYWTSASEGAYRFDWKPFIDANVLPGVIQATAQTYDFSGPNYDIGGGPMGGGGWYFGQMESHMGDGGEREEIAPLMWWEGRLIANNTENNRLAATKNCDMSGEWSSHVFEADGQTILRITDPRYTNSVVTDIAAPSGLDWSNVYATAWRGARYGDNNPQPGIASDWNREHAPAACFIPYLMEGRKWQLDQMRLWAEWAIFQSYAPDGYPDPVLFPGWHRGRGNEKGYLGDAGEGREFAWPVRLVATTAWALPDNHPDRGYFLTIAQNNLDWTSDIEAYLQSRNLGGWIHMPNVPAGQVYTRGNRIIGTAAGNSTMVTVVGDDSGVGSGTNDHGGQTGDFVNLEGFSSSAGAGLNGQHPITRVDASHFTVDVATSGNTAGEGQYGFVTGFSTPPWRLSYSMYVFDWMLRQGVWTDKGHAQQWVDRIGQMFIVMNVDNPSFSTNSGWSHAYYPSPGYARGSNIIFYNSFTEWRNANGANGSLIDTQDNYNLFRSQTHRGNVRGWNENESNSGYSYNAHSALAIAVRRGLPNAQLAFNRQAAISGQVGYMSDHPGYNITFTSGTGTSSSPPREATSVVVK